MRRLIALAAVAWACWFATCSAAAADAPLCAFSTQFEHRLLSSQAILGAAVYDLQSGVIWTGGHPGPYALHSVVKPPIAWALLTDANERDRELTDLQRKAMFYMVAWSQNPDVNTLLSLIGGLQGMNEYYERWGVPELVPLQHHKRWGSGLAQPDHLARLYAALAKSEEVPDSVRSEGFDLLREVVENHIWGASIPAGNLHGWESLIKTGNFTIPGHLDQDPAPRSQPILPPPKADNSDPTASATEAESADNRHNAPTNTVLQQQGTAKKTRATVRMNSAAIWLEPISSGGRPRYIVAIMQESFLSWSHSRKLQNEIGRILADAIIQREQGEWSRPSDHCLKRALS